MYIYVDETGDLGSVKKSGQYFIIGLLDIESPREVNIWMRRIRSKKLFQKERKDSEIKASFAREEFKKYFYNHLDKLKFRIIFVIIKKSKIPKRFIKEQGLVYLHMVEEGIKAFIQKGKDRTKEAVLTIDRKHFQKLTKEAFNTALKESLLFHDRININLKIHHTDSITDKVLQFVDFMVYAAGRKYNMKDYKLYKLIKKNIKTEILIELDDKK